MNNCPLPQTLAQHVAIGHGGGGRMMHELLSGLILPVLGAKAGAAGDAAILELAGQRLAFTSDTFVVRPWRFPGGDIGKLAACGTINDLAMVGARPLWLSCSLVLEEGFALSDLQIALSSLKAEADAAGVAVVTGDTKVVERGHGDGIYINTAGIGVIEHGQICLPSSIREGDAILLSGDLGRHGIAVLGEREGLAFQSNIESDAACLHEPVLALFAAGIEVHALRDLTRGGLASGLNELAQAAGLDAELEGSAIAVGEVVKNACALLGLDPCHIANEGRFVAVVPQGDAERALDILRGHAVSAGAARIGAFIAGRGLVRCRNDYGVARVMQVPAGELLPRIC